MITSQAARHRDVPDDQTRSIRRCSVIDPAALKTEQAEAAALAPERLNAALTQAHIAYELNGRRARVLGERLSSDAAWNIMLDLFISHCAGRHLSVSAVCIGSRSPSATALRHINALNTAGLLCRVADNKDGRRTYVKLSRTGVLAMIELLHPRS